MSDSCQFGCVGVVFFPRTQGDQKGFADLAGSCHGYGDSNGPSMPTRSFLAEYSSNDWMKGEGYFGRT
ncbi:hypothetical protein FOFC_08008 [Fusarium oxysporum]|nr:hypothetical protein FOFC_08008 [Fusarium oxysporum]